MYVCVHMQAACACVRVRVCVCTRRLQGACVWGVCVRVCVGCVWLHAGCRGPVCSVGCVCVGVCARCGWCVSVEAMCGCACLDEGVGRYRGLVVGVCRCLQVRRVGPQVCGFMC